MIIEVILISISAWLVLGYLIPLFLFPDQIILKSKIQRTRKIKRIAKRLKGKTREQTLRNVYNYITKTFTGKGERYKFLNYLKLISYNIDRIIDRKKFAACHIQNLAFTTLLINTRHFKRSDFERKKRLTRFLTAHQYLIVHLGRTKYKIDPWARVFEKL